MGYLSTLSGSQDLQKLSVEQLSEVASEIRSAIIGQVSSSGGHLAPNLGVVELTLALHYVFDFSFDRLLFDVGHQCYPHKLITGRADRLSGLRTSAGMSGFPEPLESPYDLFRVGHAGTGVSTAVGMARGDQLSGEGFNPHDNPGGRRVVTMVGDASIVNGVSMEGLNNAGTLKRQLLVILNDNGMSISKPQGALAAYFDRVRVSHTYSDLKKAGRSLLQGLPGGSMIREAYHRAGEMTKALVSEDSWFDKFGLLTVGPIDGHDLPTLIEFLAEARDIDRPMVLHVKTVKGKGLEYAEKDATTFHSPAAHRYDPDSCRVELKSSGRSFTKAFADAMCDVMRRDDKAVACTAAMPGGTGIDKVIAEFPDRSWDVGICESHGMDMMAGLAKTGFRPFFAVYSTFLQRAFDQAFQEVSLQGLPVRLCLDRAGLVGGDGSVHHGFCDVAILRTLPGAALLAPIDEPSLREALEFMRTYDEGLSAVRYPRDAVSDRFLADDCPAFELGKARLLTPDFQADERPDAAVLAFGVPAIDAMKALDMLGDEYRVAVWDARFAKPVDADMLKATIGRGVPVITVEDHGVTGGFGAAVLETASELGLDASKVTRLGLPDDWIHQDSRADQLRLARIDADGIAAAIRASVARCEVDSTSSRGVVEGTHATPAH